MAIKKFIDGKNILIGLLSSAIEGGINPVTEPEEALQVLGVKHSKGAEVAAHRYAPRRRVTTALQKCLVVRDGKVRATLYGTDDRPFKEITLKSGDIFVLLRGGYHLKFLSDTDMIEIKNGPHYDDKILL
ncbi:MAG: hypothetical protein HYY55_04650 [Candidatus Niyogibacteria bacterium]|nr:MAG: hypothetical protein HYY55_04650 [Candidatus Niyogibacteria bacterium]